MPDTLFDQAIGIGSYHPARGTHISTLDPYWDHMRPIAYGAAGNYAIPRAIRLEAQPAEQTGVFSHRKIIVRSAIGRQATRYPVYREISPVTAAALPSEQIRPRPGSEFLVSEPQYFVQGLIAQYAQMHHVIDLFDYLSVASRIGILENEQLREFSLMREFIPGGCELGVYPTRWLRATLEKLEHVGREFLTSYGERIRTYDNYQVRAVGFLAERLGSYFLLKELTRRYPQGIPKTLFGHLCVIVPDGATYAGAVAG